MNWFFFFQDTVPRSRIANLLAVLAAATMSGPVHALDGCKILLCLAGPWRQIQECVPDVRKALRKGIPHCSLATSGNTAAYHSWASAADCPPQYTVWKYDAAGNRIPVGCSAAGVINVVEAGMPYMRIWWFPDAESTSTWYSDEARARYGSLIDPRYDQDYAAWLALPIPTPPGDSTGGGS